MLTFDELVAAERVAQDKKWGEQNHHPAEWLSILMEEVGELASAVNCYEWGYEKQRAFELEKELIQVAAVAKAMWESGIRNKWLKGGQGCLNGC